MTYNGLQLISSRGFEKFEIKSTSELPSAWEQAEFGYMIEFETWDGASPPGKCHPSASTLTRDTLEKLVDFLASLSTGGEPTQSSVRLSTDLEVCRSEREPRAIVQESLRHVEVCWQPSATVELRLDLHMSDGMLQEAAQDLQQLLEAT